MRVAILETVKTTAGFEQEFDRLIFDELKKQGHEPVLYLPENSSLPVDFGVPIEYLEGGEIIDYEGASSLKKVWLSALREYRRIKWFNAAYEKALKKEVDAIVLTTATYRYLRSLHKSKLKKSPIPIIFIFLGVNPNEKPKFLREARKCEKYHNIKLKITSLRNDFLNDGIGKIEVINPPVLVPTSVNVEDRININLPMSIGFFGHYRKGEKDVDGIIKAFLEANSAKKARLVIQAVPTTDEDRRDIDSIIEKYKDKDDLTFITRKLYGKEWYDNLQKVDVLFLPYSNERYLYNWSAVYFNALGMYKPSLATKYLNPEVLSSYSVGLEVDIENLDVLTKQLNQFIENYSCNVKIYEKELHRFNADFSTKVFLNNLLN